MKGLKFDDFIWLTCCRHPRIYVISDPDFSPVLFIFIPRPCPKIVFMAVLPPQPRQLPPCTGRVPEPRSRKPVVTKTNCSSLHILNFLSWEFKHISKFLFRRLVERNDSAAGICCLLTGQPAEGFGPAEFWNKTLSLSFVPLSSSPRDVAVALTDRRNVPIHPPDFYVSLIRLLRLSDFHFFLKI